MPSLSGYARTGASITIALKTGALPPTTFATFVQDTSAPSGDTAFNGGSYNVYYTTANITTLPGSAFYGNTNLLYIKTGNSVTIIGDDAFNRCSALATISLPNVTSILSYAFNRCSALATINLPNVTSVGSQAFANCSALTSINLPNVTGIGNSAFNSCLALATISLPNVTSIGNNAFYSCPSMIVYTKSTNTFINSTNYLTYFPSGSELSTNLSSTILSVFTINGTSVTNNPNISVPHGTTSVSVIVTPVDPFAYYTITGNTGLQPGSNTLTVNVIAQNATTQTYVVTVSVLLPAPSITDIQPSIYSFRYPKKRYTLSTNTPILIKPRQNGINPQDQRSWRISPKLPEGLKFSYVSGIISGTPTKIAPSTIYNIWSTSEVFLTYKKQLTIEIV